MWSVEPATGISALTLREPKVTKDVNEIRAFWDGRAAQFGDSWQATLGERHLRMLEIEAMVRMIRNFRPQSVLDVGCGNGYSTKIYARTFPACRFVGIDFSDAMILLARVDGRPNCEFRVADISVPESLPPCKFDVIISQRCLQNLPDYAHQAAAIRHLLDALNEEGRLLLMECSTNGVRQLNRWRALIGKKPLQNLEPWHNTFFQDETLIHDFGARIIHFSATYMLLSKVIHGRLARLGRSLPSIFSFGYDKLYVIERRGR